MKYALLIDSENAQPNMDFIFQELSKYGDTPIRILVGDFTKSQVSPWLEVCKKHAITCLQTMNFTHGKNSLDISLVIEGMKILYEKDFIDGIIIVASDSDYTPLAREWRNAGKDVIGIGRKNSTESYRASCNSFIYTENLSKSIIDSKDRTNLTPIESIEEVTASVLNDNNGKALLSIVVSAVKKAFSDFDVRNYGYQKAIDFFKNELHSVELNKEDLRTYSLQFKSMLASKADNMEKKEKKEIKKNNPKDEYKNSKKDKKEKASDKEALKEASKKNKKEKKPAKEKKLSEENQKKIKGAYNSFGMERVSINDIALKLTLMGIKCRALGFKSMKELLGKVNGLTIEGNYVLAKPKTVVLMSEEDDSELDF